MQGYTFDGARRAWVCSKCAALVDDPQRHEASHQELIMVFTRWANLLKEAEDAP